MAIVRRVVLWMNKAKTLRIVVGDDLEGFYVPPHGEQSASHRQLSNGWGVVVERWSATPSGMPDALGGSSWHKVDPDADLEEVVEALAEQHLRTM